MGFSGMTFLTKAFEKILAEAIRQRLEQRELQKKIVDLEEYKKNKKQIKAIDKP